MKLAAYMIRHGLDDSAMAEKVREPDLHCDRTMIGRYRREERRPDWAIIKRIAEVTEGDVSADDWMTLEPAT